MYWVMRIAPSPEWPFSYPPNGEGAYKLPGSIIGLLNIQCVWFEHSGYPEMYEEPLEETAK